MSGGGRPNDIDIILHMALCILHNLRNAGVDNVSVDKKNHHKSAQRLQNVSSKRRVCFKILLEIVMQFLLQKIMDSRSYQKFPLGMGGLLQYRISFSKFHSIHNNFLLLNGTLTTVYYSKASHI